MRRDECEWQVEYVDTLQERTTAVFSCTCTSPSQQFTAVLKAGVFCTHEVIGSNRDSEARRAHFREATHPLRASTMQAAVIKLLNAEGVQHIPSLWHEGLLFDVPCMIITPLGRPITFEEPAETLVEVVRDAAQVLYKLSTLKVAMSDVIAMSLL